MTTLGLRDLGFLGGLGGGAALWTPAQISTALWLDAADASTITTVSGAVSQWNDKSGNGRNFAQGNAANRPTLTTVNSLGAILYDGANDALSRNVESWMYNYPLTAIAVIRANAFTSSYNGVFGFYSDNGGNAAGWSTFIRNTTKSAVYATTGGSQTNYDNTGALTYATNTTYIFQANIANNSIISYGNGVLDGSSSGFWTLRTDLGSGIADIGADSRFGRYTNWAICEAMILSQAATNTRQQLEGYLAHKWGLAANLPADHPYKSAPPTV